MAEPFKNLIGARLVHDLAEHLSRSWPGLPRKRFLAQALEGLDDLELKARATHLSRALEVVLPPDFDAAASILERSLAPARLDEDLGALQTSPAGLAGWVIWPMTEFVARVGLDQPARALQALHALTQRFTAEYAVRPFLDQHRELTFGVFHGWLRDPSPHVRRLVSEGSRPRLPWGMQLKFLVADPSPTLPLLEVLQHDASPYVRRSVANHWNDIAKDHPDLVAGWLEKHLSAASKERRAMMKHASRTLIKKGHPRVLKAWGIGAPLRGAAELRIAPKKAAIGSGVTLEVRLVSSSPKSQRLVVDYVVHHVTASGATSPKVRKGWNLELGPHEDRRLSKQHSLRVVSTRRYHRGKHAVDLLVNGKVVAGAQFVLE
jgi:3-methyladenine DNA glycosylase AlkC